MKPMPELGLSRPILHRLLVIHFPHGDFVWYHQKFSHADVKLTCSCGRPKDPKHIVHCRKTARKFAQWPQKPRTRVPPTTATEAFSYLSSLLKKPKTLQALLYGVLLQNLPPLSYNQGLVCGRSRARIYII